MAVPQCLPVLGLLVVLGIAQPAHAGGDDCYTDRNIASQFNQSCYDTVARRSSTARRPRQQSAPSMVCPEAWNAFMSAWANKDPGDVNISSYDDYYDVLPVVMPPNDALFWSGTPMITEFVSTMNDMMCSSFTVPASAVANGLGTYACWCGTAGGGINYDTPCPPDATTPFWASFSCMMGNRARGVAFFITWGERPGGAYQEGNFFGTYEFPALQPPRVTKLVVLTVHQEGMGESCGQGSLATLESRSIAKFGAPGGYGCYDVIGDAKTTNMTEQQMLADMIVPIIRGEQAAAGTVKCQRPCQNGGTCTGLNECTCAPGWTGATCGRKFTCRPKCRNGGKCTGRNQCTCTDKWTGKTCRQPKCTPACAAGGTCMRRNMCAYPSTFSCSMPAP